MDTTDKLSRLQNVLDALPCGVYWKDRKGTYLGCNKAQANYWGESSPEDIEGKTDDDLYFRYRLKAIRETDSKVLQDKTPIITEDVTKLPDGDEQFFMTHKMPLVDSDGKICGIVGVTQDMTEDRKRLKAHVVRLQAHELFSVKAGLTALQMSLEALGHALIKEK